LPPHLALSSGEAEQPVRELHFSRRARFEHEAGAPSRAHGRDKPSHERRSRLTASAQYSHPCPFSQMGEGDALLLRRRRRQRGGAGFELQPGEPGVEAVGG
jgi:hypothetical protein